MYVGQTHIDCSEWCYNSEFGKLRAGVIGIIQASKGHSDRNMVKRINRAKKPRVNSRSGRRGFFELELR